MHEMKLREATITSSRCQSKETLHEYLQEALALPDYYGRNLSALADCLSETAAPMIVTFAINEDDLPAGMQAYALRLAQVVAREALANDNVSLIIEHR